jgi:hypothetical protein
MNSRARAFFCSLRVHFFSLCPAEFVASAAGDARHRQRPEQRAGF